jgi:high-affinity iron transporter
MLASLLIVFREILEAGLIVGVTLAATEGIAQRSFWVWGGVGLGLAGAALVALVAARLSESVHGVGQVLFNASILIVAVAMLSWHALWMSRHGREMSASLKSMGRAVTEGQRTLWAITAVIAIAILREGSEVVLFLTGISAESGNDAVQLLGGALAGLALGAACSLLLYRGLLKVPASRLLTVTGGLIIFLAAGMAGQAAAFLAQADLVPPLGSELWDSSSFLRDDSIFGRVLHAMIGYSDRPMGIQLTAYVLVLVLLFASRRAIERKVSQNRT